MADEAKNVIWKGKGEPLIGTVSIGADVVEMPDVEAQRAGFYSPIAFVLTQRGDGYKEFVDLSQTKAPKTLDELSAAAEKASKPKAAAPPKGGEE